MTVGRRGFLRAIGLAPVAAKQAADAAIAKISGFSSEGVVGLGGARQYIAGGGPDAVANGGSNALSIGEKTSRVFSFLRRSGIPSWEEERIRMEQRYVYALDPDLAALKSFSMNVKIATQRQRNFEREVARLKQQTTYQAHIDAFRRRHGFWLWW